MQVPTVTITLPPPASVSCKHLPSMMLVMVLFWLNLHAMLQSHKLPAEHWPAGSFLQPLRVSTAAFSASLHERISQQYSLTLLRPTFVGAELPGVIPDERSHTCDCDCALHSPAPKLVGGWGGGGGDGGPSLQHPSQSVASQSLLPLEHAPGQFPLHPYWHLQLPLPPPQNPVGGGGGGDGGDGGDGGGGDGGGGCGGA